MTQCFLEVDDLIEQEETSSGTTAAVCWISAAEVNNVKRLQLCCGNVGDSRVIICRENGPVRISCEHNAGTNLEECKRIRSSGGFVFGGRVYGICAVTRALGDHQYKECIIGYPHIYECELTPQDKWIIIASDGLWSVVEDEAAHERIMQQESAQKAAEALGMLAFQCCSIDNVGIVVLKLDWK